MDGKNSFNFGDTFGGDQREYGGKSVLNRFDHDLYDEAKNVKDKVFRVKKSKSLKNEKWKVIENDRVVFILDGAKLSKREREFLRTPEGFNFLLAEGKAGIKSFSKLKISLKAKID